MYHSKEHNIFYKVSSAESSISHTLVRSSSQTRAEKMRQRYAFFPIARFHYQMRYQNFLKTDSRNTLHELDKHPKNMLHGILLEKIDFLIIFYFLGHNWKNFDPIFNCQVPILITLFDQHMCQKSFRSERYSDVQLCNQQIALKFIPCGPPPIC